MAEAGAARTVDSEAEYQMYQHTALDVAQALEQACKSIAVVAAAGSEPAVAAVEEQEEA